MYPKIHCGYHPNTHLVPLKTLHAPYHHHTVGTLSATADIPYTQHTLSQQAGILFGYPNCSVAISQTHCTLAPKHTEGTLKHVMHAQALEHAMQHGRGTPPQHPVDTSETRCRTTLPTPLHKLGCYYSRARSGHHVHAEGTSPNAQDALPNTPEVLIPTRQRLALPIRHKLTPPRLLLWLVVLAKCLEDTCRAPGWD